MCLGGCVTSFLRLCLLVVRFIVKVCESGDGLRGEYYKRLGMFYNIILSLRNTPLMDSKASWTFVRVSLVFPVTNVSVRLIANREVFEKSGRSCRSIRGADPLHVVPHIESRPRSCLDFVLRLPLIFPGIDGPYHGCKVGCSFPGAHLRYCSRIHTLVVQVPLPPADECRVSAEPTRSGTAAWRRQAGN